MDRIDLRQDLQPITSKLQAFFEDYPQVNKRMKAAQILALGEAAQKWPQLIGNNQHELIDVMKMCGFLLVCEEVVPGVLDEIISHYVTSLAEIFPNVTFDEWR